MNNIEIPFGAKDSELQEWEYTIPEGYEATIENGKVKVRKEGSEDGRIKKIITGSVFYQYGAGAEYKDVLDYLDKLEKQKDTNSEKPKECSELITLVANDAFENCMLRYLQSAANRKDDDEIIADTKVFKEKLLEILQSNKQKEPITPEEEVNHPLFLKGFDVGKIVGEVLSVDGSSGKPAEWSEEDEKALNTYEDEITDWCGKYNPEYRDIIRTTAYHFYAFRPHWKPSKEQMYSLGTVIKGAGECSVGSVGYNLQSLYNDLKAL